MAYAKALQAIESAVHELNEFEPVDELDAPGAYAGGSETSQIAAGLSRLVQGSVRRAIIDELSVLPAIAIGLADFELERRLKKPHQTVSSARNRLVELGWIVDSGHTREAPSGRPTALWSLSPAAMNLVDSAEWTERRAS
jgi:hypothetical protein